ncbi:hypothetical protein [Agromyces humi]|uniref:hypothetical protein n=1 Tax=Agromyces humi TaxID=1766800 RepID=UPI00135BF75D|nr:hypothetical protein [Agromyces humi]
MRANLFSKINPNLFRQGDMWVSGDGYQHTISDPEDFSDAHLANTIWMLEQNAFVLWVVAGHLEGAGAAVSYEGEEVADPLNLSARAWLDGTVLMKALRLELASRDAGATIARWRSIRGTRVQLVAAGASRQS